ncbi:hypothetical protein [uncultured Alsobacter sp.]|uniref:hypothetical protein n=1 Tax=uncultured Alsobacter sp. TaxID=1748258 RepID=UPI0025FEAF4B|nr:hypothetical protein [uncultured Alsobacter sp.]
MSPKSHGRAMATALATGAALLAAPAVGQVLQQPSSDPQMRLQIQLPPAPAPDAARCPDTGSFVVVGPTVKRGEPITAQAWNDCADLPSRSAPQQPLIGVEIPVPMTQGRPRR